MSAETIERAAVSIERDGAVATIVLCRPHRRNALDLDAWIALREAVLELQEDAQIRSVILTGSDGTFCAAPIWTSVARRTRSIACVSSTQRQSH